MSNSLCRVDHSAYPCVRQIPLVGTTMEVRNVRMAIDFDYYPPEGTLSINDTIKSIHVVTKEVIKNSKYCVSAFYTDVNDNCFEISDKNAIDMLGSKRSAYVTSDGFILFYAIHSVIVTHDMETFYNFPNLENEIIMIFHSQNDENRDLVLLQNSDGDRMCAELCLTCEERPRIELRGMKLVA